MIKITRLYIARWKEYFEGMQDNTPNEIEGKNNEYSGNTGNIDHRKIKTEEVTKTLKMLKRDKDEITK